MSRGDKYPPVRNRGGEGVADVATWWAQPRGGITWSDVTGLLESIRTPEVLPLDLRGVGGGSEALLHRLNISTTVQFYETVPVGTLQTKEE